jgi:hypothetical protein
LQRMANDRLFGTKAGQWVKVECSLFWGHYTRQCMS